MQKIYLHYQIQGYIFLITLAPSSNVTSLPAIEQPKPVKPVITAYVPPVKVIAMTGGGGDIEIVKPTAKYATAG